MAGSYSHITTKKGKFRGIDLIDNLGDAYEALEECWGMIQILADFNQERIRDAERRYQEGFGNLGKRQ